jgi:hypothetical protein
LPSATATSRPSGENSTRAPNIDSVSSVCSCPEASSATTSLRGDAGKATRAPSGEKATARQLASHGSTRGCTAVAAGPGPATSHTRTVSSSLALASCFPSREKLRPMTLPWWPTRRSQLSDWASHSVMSPSTPPAAKRLPSGAKATA